MKKYKKILLIILFLFFLFLPFIGGSFISPGDLLEGIENERYIFLNLRLPRIIFSFLAGGILTLSGLIFQSIFKNDLATPFTLGVASGASFGAIIAIHLNLTISFLIFDSLYLFAFMGALLSVMFILTILKIKKDYSISTIILAGIAINFLFSSCILFFQYVMNHSNLSTAVKWMMGSINVFGFKKVVMVLPFYLILVFLAYYYRYHLDILFLGDELALSKGLEVYKIRKKLFIIVSFIVAATVSLSGPIGFVGLVIPHLIKLMIGRKHKNLIFYSFIIGGVFLSIADTAARTVISPVEIPVGVITSIIGVPFFLYLLIRR